MRKILLLRHAKSSWEDQGLRDHDRPLGPRGWKDLPIMANRLKNKDIRPNLILSSTALRARQTAEIILEELGLPQSILRLEARIYHASATEILKQIQSQGEEIETLFVVGHNPGFNDLIELLGGTIPNLPTSGQYGFISSAENWGLVSANNSKTWFVDYPKK